MARMKVITVEEHYTSKQVIEANKACKQPDPPPSPRQQIILKYFAENFPWDDLPDFEKRLKFMDDNDIDMQVLSYNNPVADSVAPEDAVRICRLANDITKERIDAYPGRFAGFATLPVADPEAAAVELERCVKDLGLVGAQMAGRFKGRFFNEAEFLPIFAKAAELDVPIYLHPAMIPQTVQEANYYSDAYSVETAFEFSLGGYGWHSEVGIQIVRLILSGVFDKYPNLKIITGHWGETIPAFLTRLDDIVHKGLTGLNKNISEYFKEHVYVTPSGIMAEDQLEFIVKLLGADHVMYSVDYPFIKPSGIYGFIADAEFLTQEQKELIMYKNAERILKIK